MGGLGMTELIVILVIVLIIFGAGKLPSIGEALGKGIKNFKGAITDEENKKNIGNKPDQDKSDKS